MVYCPHCGHEFSPSSASLRKISTSSAQPSHFKRNILVAVVILLVAIAAFRAGTSSKPSGTPSGITVTAIQTATVVQTVSMVQTYTTAMTTTAGALKTVETQYDVVIRYTEDFTNQIGYYQPKAGYTFLIIALQIQNNVNTEFDVNPLYFHVTVNNVKYDIDIATYSLSDTLASEKVLKGGILAGSIAFQVPEGTVNYTPSYEAFETANVYWIHY